MTFLSVQSFDANGEIKVFAKRRQILDKIEEHIDNKGTNEAPMIKGKARIKYETNTMTEEDITPFNSIEEAEEYVLDPDNLFMFISMPPVKANNDDEKFILHARRASANISSRTNRGFGNTVVYHPSNERHADLLRRDPEFAGVEFFENERTTDEGILILYRGENEIDQPLIYVPGKGLLMNGTLVDVDFYGKFVRT